MRNKDRDVEALDITVDENDEISVEWTLPGGADWPSRSEGILNRDQLLVRSTDLLVDLLQRNMLGRRDQLAVLGDLMFTTLFGPPTVAGEKRSKGPGQLLIQAMQAQSNSKNRRLLRVSMEIDRNDRLASWPWEYLHVPPGFGDFSGKFLGVETDLMLTRKVALTGQRQAVEVLPPLRILFVAQTPERGDDGNPELPPIEYDSVKEELHAAAKEAPGLVEIITLAARHDRHGEELDDPDARIDTDFETFVKLVEEFEPHIIHIIAHGRHEYSKEDRGWVAEIAFRDESGAPQWIREDDILVHLDPRPRLIFLQACESGRAESNPYHAVSGLARALARGIPAVVAMQFEVKQKMANQFAKEFYACLMDQLPIEVAMHEGARALTRALAAGQADQRDPGIPVLYLREDRPLLPRIDQSSPKPNVGDTQREADREPVYARENRWQPSHTERPRDPAKVRQPSGDYFKTVVPHEDTRR